MANKCILDSRRKGGCASCSPLCPHKIALHGLNGTGGRVGATGVPDDYRYLTVATSPARDGMEEFYEVLDKYVGTFHRQFDEDGERIKSFYLWSKSPGTGKTTTAVALMNDYIAVNYLGSLKRGEQPAQKPAIFLDINSIQRTYNLASQSDDKPMIRVIAAELDRAARVPFLVMDDVGIRDATEAFRGLLHDVINYRTTNGLPTIYTSNVNLAQFGAIYGERLYDRVRDKCQPMEFKGNSNRGK